MTTLPSLYISHGSPMTALRPGATGERLSRARRDAAAAARDRGGQRALAGRMHRMSAARRSRRRCMTSAAFPPPLYQLRYPAPGDPALAAEVAQRLADSRPRCAASMPGRGLDHGVWVPLRLMYPQADIPVVPLSIQPDARAGPPARRRPGAGAAARAAACWWSARAASPTTCTTSPPATAPSARRPTCGRSSTGSSSGWPPAIPKPCSTTAARRRSPSARTRPTNTCCRCSWRSARPGQDTRSPAAGCRHRPRLPGDGHLPIRRRGQARRAA